MTQLRHRYVMLWMIAGLIALSPIASAVAFAKTTGVASDGALESGPCYQALVDKNAETPSTAPNRELGDACRVENGDVNKAWARVIRLWGSSSADVPDYDSFVRADAPAPGTVPIWFVIASIVLTYGVAATPIRAFAMLMHGDTDKAALARQAVASLALRFAIALILLGVFSLPGGSLIGCILLIAMLIRELMLRRTTVSQPAGNELPPNAAAVFLAHIINDAAGGAIGLVALALLANHSPGLLAGALLLSILLSIPALIAARRRIRMQPIAIIGMTAGLVALVALYALDEPLVAASVETSASIRFIVPLALALVAIAAGWRNWRASQGFGG